MYKQSVSKQRVVSVHAHWLPMSLLKSSLHGPIVRNQSKPLPALVVSQRHLSIVGEHQRLPMHLLSGLRRSVLPNQDRLLCVTTL